jgi:hypothetical protein
MLTKKIFEMGFFNLNIQHSDIIPIVNYAWTRSFANTQINLQATRERGWDPLNQILLTHPDIASSKSVVVDSNIQDHRNIDIEITRGLIALEINGVSQQSTFSNGSDVMVPNNDVIVPEKYVDFDELNFNEGYAGHVIQSILNKSQRDAQTVKNIKLKSNHGNGFVASMKNVKRWSAGVILKKCKRHLDKEVLEMAASAKRKKDDTFRDRIRKLHNDFLKKKLAFDNAIKELNAMKTKTSIGIPLKLLKPLVVWKKRKGDKPTPVKRKETRSYQGCAE